MVQGKIILRNIQNLKIRNSLLENCFNGYLKRVDTVYREKQKGKSFPNCCRSGTHIHKRKKFSNTEIFGIKSPPIIV